MQESFTFPGGMAELMSAIDRIERLFLQNLVERELAAELRLVAEEGLVNIIQHAYGEDEGDIEVTISVSQAEVRLVFRDRGQPFNPLEHPEPDLDVPVDEREDEGGLGIHLMRSLTDDQTYSREGEENVLVLVKRRGML